MLDDQYSDEILADFVQNWARRVIEGLKAM